LKKILIIRFSSIGDIVLTTPVIRGLKKRHPNCEIHYLTKSKYAILLKNNPYLSKIVLLENSLFDCIKRLRKENYNVIVDLHNNLRSFIIKRFLNKKAFSFNKLNWEKWLYTNFKINKLPDKHIVDRYLEASDKLGVAIDNEGLDFFIDSKVMREVEKVFPEVNERYVCFCIGGQHYTKKLPLKKIINICQHLNLRTILIGGPEDKAAGDKIAEICKNTLNTCGNLTIHQSAFIIQKSLLLITHDTGMMHIASALNKKIISIWGNTVPAFGMYPYMPKNRDKFKIIENRNLKCRPCSKIGYNECPKEHFRCMNEIDTVSIVKAIEVFLN